jgi:2-keto-4-pentenoate hydratase
LPQHSTMIVNSSVTVGTSVTAVGIEIGIVVAVVDWTTEMVQGVRDRMTRIAVVAVIETAAAVVELPAADIVAAAGAAHETFQR